MTIDDHVRFLHI